MKKQVIYLLIVLLAGTMMYCAKKQTASTASTLSTVTTSESIEAAPDYKAYVGKYKTLYDEVGDINIILENGELYGISEGRPKTRLQYESKDTFVVPNLNNVKISFKRNANQKVTGLTLLYQGEEFTGEKVE